MVGYVNDKGITELGVGLISVGWMGKLHSRAYQAIPLVYPELKIRPRLVHAADTAPDRAEYARDVLGYAKGCTDYRDVLADPEVDVLFIGPRDLSHDLGVPGDTAAPAFVEALETVLAAGKRHGKACGLLVNDGPAAAGRRQQGWTFVAIGSDSTLLAAASRSALSTARSPS